MNGEGVLERRYRRLLAWFPADHRRVYGEEMIGVLLASAPDDQQRPSPAEAADLIGGGLSARFRSTMTRMGEVSWRDALAVCSTALPAMLLGILVVRWVREAWPFGPEWTYPLSDYYLPALAVALPVLVAFRFRREAAGAAILAAALFSMLAIRSALRFSTDGLEASFCIALAVQAIALTAGPGPRRGVEIMTWKTWLVVAASGLGTGAISQYYYRALIPTGPAVLVAIAILAAVGIALALTLPGRVARGLIALIAIPAVPCAVFAVQFMAAANSNGVGSPFPNLVFLIVFVLVGAATGMALRQQRRSRPTA